MNRDMYDVLAIGLRTREVRVLERNLSLLNAEAVVALAIMRRGVEEEFYATATSGLYEDGDIWFGAARALIPNAQ